MLATLEKTHFLYSSPPSGTGWRRRALRAWVKIGEAIINSKIPVNQKGSCVTNPLKTSILKPKSWRFDSEPFSKLKVIFRFNNMWIFQGAIISGGYGIRFLELKLVDASEIPSENPKTCCKIWNINRFAQIPSINTEWLKGNSRQPFIHVHN